MSRYFIFIIISIFFVNNQQAHAGPWGLEDLSFRDIYRSRNSYFEGKNNYSENKSWTWQATCTEDPSPEKRHYGGAITNFVEISSGNDYTSTFTDKSVLLNEVTVDLFSQLNFRSYFAGKQIVSDPYGTSITTYEKDGGGCGSQNFEGYEDTEGMDGDTYVETYADYHTVQKYRLSMSGENPDPNNYKCLKAEISVWGVFPEPPNDMKPFKGSIPARRMSSGQIITIDGKMKSGPIHQALQKFTRVEWVTNFFESDECDTTNKEK